MTEQRSRIPLPPWARRILGAATLGIGVLVIGRLVSHDLPRDVEVRVRLAGFRDEPTRARALSLVLLRGGTPVRTMATRFETTVPLEFHRTLSVAPGDYHAVLDLELAGRAVSRESEVHIEPGGTVYIPAPIAP